jgi:sulfur carrier protein ThiS
MRLEVENPFQIRYRNQIYELTAGLTLLEALSALGIDPESVLAIREGEMIGGAYRLEEGDEVRLVAVISGGD